MTCYVHIAVCYNKKEAIPCERDQNGTWFNNTCFNETYLSVYDELKKYCNSTDCYWVTENYEKDLLANNTAKQQSSTQQYYEWVFVISTSKLQFPPQNYISHLKMIISTAKV